MVIVMENKNPILMYEELAKRNNWQLSIQDNRPYFMKDGNYAIPDETTSLEDKILLAHIISEGSHKMAELILNCWENNIIISGPCSGIAKFHDKKPSYLHFSFKAKEDIIKPLYEDLRNIFPQFDHLFRQGSNGNIRYDIDYLLNGKELTEEEADNIFAIINDNLNLVLSNKVVKEK